MTAITLQTVVVLLYDISLHNLECVFLLGSENWELERPVTAGTQARWSAAAGGIGA